MKLLQIDEDTFVAITEQVQKIVIDDEYIHIWYSGGDFKSTRISVAATDVYTAQEIIRMRLQAL